MIGKTNAVSSTVDSSLLTATAADIKKGKIAIVKDFEDPVTGTLDILPSNILAGRSIGGVNGTATNDATANAGYIYNGKTAYVNGNKVVGNMTVGSILNFNAQAYSGRQILLNWQNPYAATGMPFSGVFINYSTSGYPGMWSGTRIYTGYGNNATSGGWSQVIVTLPALNTTYYFSCNAYCTSSAGDFYGNTINYAAATQADLWVNFTYSQNYTIPAGYTTADICCVGGGGGGVKYNGYPRGGGGGGGYVTWTTGVAVSGTYYIIVGAGAPPTVSNPNGDIKAPGSSFGNLISAAGGMCGNDNWGGWGGSGGGAACNDNYKNKRCGDGGSNGTSGSADEAGFHQGGRGSWSTTQAFGWGTLYAGGGGGGGGSSVYSGTVGGAGGAGGGGHGSNGNNYSGGWFNIAESGGANTGGGGGGGGTSGGNGGSGIVIAHIY